MVGDRASGAARVGAIVLVLALLGCTAKPGDPCESGVNELVTRLEVADPPMQARLVGVDPDTDAPPLTCEIPVLYVFDGYHGNHLTDEGREVFARACMAGPEFDWRMSRGDFYDSCGFARFGVVSRSEYLLQPKTDPFAWTLHQAMLDQGLGANQARPITRAWLLWERADAAAFEPVTDLRLPAIEGERCCDGLVVQISPSALVIGGRSVARLERGVLDPDDHSEWFGELEENFYKVESIYEGRGEPPDIALIVAADIDTPPATISEVFDMAGRIGYTRFATVGELQPFVYTTQPVSGPFPRPD